jgi:prepilin-type N-terminal cleavage/methylation domain-containing protein
MKKSFYSFLSKRHNKNTMPKLVSGFTLVELLITITIFVIITGVVLVNSNSFNNSVLLSNFAYDVALTIKQAQSFGVNVKESSTGSFTTSYGIYFDTSQSNTNFVLFNDANNDKKYSDVGGVTSCPTNSLECIQRYSMKSGSYIQNICVGNDDQSCTTQASQLLILFVRPNLNAIIYANGGGTAYNYAKISLAAGNNATSSVVVTSIGQIFVKK